MEPALLGVVKLLEDLFFGQLKDKASRYAKKRIKIDVKAFVKNCMSADKMRFTAPFREQHFNLLVSKDFYKMDPEAIDQMEPPTDDEVQAIAVHDKYSAVK
mmetsp:Transcript_19614/g.30225  ORF Transcript_19614/g.30225 Transcript_19614/m.30225 type:complete len:101 (+) Transcript_19614:3104-3406(+)